MLELQLLILIQAVPSRRCHHIYSAELAPEGQMNNKSLSIISFTYTLSSSLTILVIVVVVVVVKVVVVFSIVSSRYTHLYRH